MAEIGRIGQGSGQVLQGDIAVLIILLNEIIPVWEQFGCHLPMSYDLIKQIKGGGPQSRVENKLIEVLMWYKNKEGTKDWEDIVKALKGIGNNDLASRVPENGPVPVNGDLYISAMMDSHHLNEVAAEWRSFGLQLGVPYSELKAIDNRHTLRACLEELLAEWISAKGKEAKISAIIEACKKAGNPALAERLMAEPAILEIMNRRNDT